MIELKFHIYSCDVQMNFMIHQKLTSKEPTNPCFLNPFLLPCKPYNLYLIFPTCLFKGVE